jgi:hypothetical protein
VFLLILQVCPLCRSEVRLFFINFNEKILICENSDCEYPFGHENILFLTVQDSPTASGSIMSTAAWSDIEKMNNIYEADEQMDAKPESREYFKHKNENSKSRKLVEKQEKLLSEVKKIKKLSIELSASEQAKGENVPEILNEKWIKNLLNKQKTSGVSLLKPEEVRLFKTKQLDLGLGELKIDIDMGNDNNMSSIKIELANEPVKSNDTQNKDDLGT